VAGIDGRWKTQADYGFWPEAHVHCKASFRSSDGKWAFAAVGEGDADIVQMDGLLK
jgi:hypothetical protein